MVEYGDSKRRELLAEQSEDSETELQAGSFFSQNPLLQFDGAVHTNKFGMGSTECQLSETVPQLTQLL
jgi:hypothetical protein